MISENKKQLSIGDLIELLLKMALEAGSKKAVAEQLKVSPQYLGDVMAQKRAPGERMLTALNLRAETIYVQKKRDAKKKAG